MKVKYSAVLVFGSLVACWGGGSQVHAEEAPKSVPFFLFSADHPSEGRQLFGSDGTRAGTRKIHELNGASIETWPLPGRVVVVTTTRKGTERVLSIDSAGQKTVVENDLLSKARDIQVVGVALAKLWLVMSDGQSRHLFSTDGTTAGTRSYQLPSDAFLTQVFKFKDEPHFVSGSFRKNILYAVRNDAVEKISELPSDNGRTYPNAESIKLRNGATSYVSFGDKFVFPVYSNKHGRELWVSNGTFNGTKVLKEISPRGGDGMAERRLYRVNNKALFIGDDAASGRELWTTDGTPEGTVLLKDIVKGPQSSLYEIYGNREGKKLYFFASGEKHCCRLWETDGTTAGTRELDLKSGTSPIYVKSPAEHLAWYQGDLYFPGYEPMNASHSRARYGLYRYSPNAKSTTLISNFTQDGCSYRKSLELGSYAYELTTFANGVVFGATNQFGVTKAVEDCQYARDSNYEPWVFDPAEGKPRILRDIALGRQNASFPRQFTAPSPVSN